MRDNQDKCGLVYCLSRKDCEEVSKAAAEEVVASAESQAVAKKAAAEMAAAKKAAAKKMAADKAEAKCELRVSEMEKGIPRKAAKKCWLNNSGIPLRRRPAASRGASGAVLRSRSRRPSLAPAASDLPLPTRHPCTPQRARRARSARPGAPQGSAATRRATWFPSRLPGLAAREAGRICARAADARTAGQACRR